MGKLLDLALQAAQLLLRSGEQKRPTTTRPRPGAPAKPSTSTKPGTATPATPGRSSVREHPVATAGLPPFSYSPAPDGKADPGEVVWTWVPYEDDPSRGKDRPVLVLGRIDGRLLIAQLTSKNHHLDARQEAQKGRYWMDVGSGDWDAQGRPSQLRLDRLLTVTPGEVRREGAALNRERFLAVTTRLREFHRR